MPTLVGIAVLEVSLLNFLSAEHYPLLKAEIAPLAVFLFALPLVAGLVYAAAEPIGRGIMQVALCFVALDLNFDGWSVPIATALIAALFNRRLMTFLGIATVVVALTLLPRVTLFDGNQAASGAPQPATRETSLPPVVHIILDEHIGIEGLIGSGTQEAAMKSSLRSFYLNNGFRVFGGAYSEYHRTINSIPFLLNFGEVQAWANQDVQLGTTVQKNKYFEYLKSRGYNINVYQSHFVDYCLLRIVDYCRTIPESNLLTLKSTSIDLGDKAALINYQFVNRSRPLQSLTSALPDSLGISLGHIKLPQAPAAIEALKEVTLRLANPSAGEAFFVHVLTPHYPYVVDRECRLKPYTSWENRRTKQTPTSDQELDSAYFEQLTCVLRTLRPLIDAAGRTSIVMIHGDHGSRITHVDPGVATIGTFSAEDMIAAFSTLYAVRAPSVPAGYDPRPLPIGELFTQFVQSDFQSADVKLPAGFVPTVVLDEPDWAPSDLRQPLPPDWPKTDFSGNVANSAR